MLDRQFIRNLLTSCSIFLNSLPSEIEHLLLEFFFFNFKLWNSNLDVVMMSHRSKFNSPQEQQQFLSASLLKLHSNKPQSVLHGHGLMLKCGVTILHCCLLCGIYIFIIQWVASLHVCCPWSTRLERLIFNCQNKNWNETPWACISRSFSLMTLK